MFFLFLTILNAFYIRGLALESRKWHSEHSDEKYYPIIS